MLLRVWRRLIRPPLAKSTVACMADIVIRACVVSPTRCCCCHVLLARYQSKVPSECSPGDGTPLVVYKNLVSDIEAVFTIGELEKKAAITDVEQVRGAQKIVCDKVGKSRPSEPLLWPLVPARSSGYRL